MSKNKRNDQAAMEPELASAIDKRDAEQLKALIAEKPGRAFSIDAHGRTALILAAASGWTLGAQTLAGVSDADWESAKGTAFHHAVKEAGRRHRGFAISRSLRALLGSTVERSGLAEHEAKMFGLEACCEFLIPKESLEKKSREGESPLLFACSTLAPLHPELLLRLIPALANAQVINEPGPLGDTPLICAAAGKTSAAKASIEALLDAGADPRMANQEGKTALMAMLREGPCHEGDRSFNRLVEGSDLLAKHTTSKMSTLAFAALHQRDSRIIFKVLSALERASSREVVQAEIEDVCSRFLAHPGFSDFPLIARSWREKEDLSRQPSENFGLKSKKNQRL